MTTNRSHYLTIIALSLFLAAPTYSMQYVAEVAARTDWRPVKQALSQAFAKADFQPILKYKKPIILAACALGAGWWLWKRHTAHPTVSFDQNAHNERQQQRVTAWNNYIQTPEGQWFSAAAQDDINTMSQYQKQILIDTPVPMSQPVSYERILQGDTALHVACRNQRWDVVRWLFTHNTPRANANAITPLTGQTALGIIVRTPGICSADQRPMLEGMRMLLANKADPNAGTQPRRRGHEDWIATALNELVIRPLNIEREEYQPVIDLLLATGADYHATRDTILRRASETAKILSRGTGQPIEDIQENSKVKILDQRWNHLYTNGDYTKPTAACKAIRAQINLDNETINARFEAAAKARVAQQHSAAAAGAGAH